MPDYYLTDIHYEYLDKDSDYAYEEAQIQKAPKNFLYAKQHYLFLPEERLSELSLAKSVPTPEGAYYYELGTVFNYRKKNSKGYFDYYSKLYWSKSLSYYPEEIQNWIRNNENLIETYLTDITKVLKGLFEIKQN